MVKIKRPNNKITKLPLEEIEDFLKSKCKGEKVSVSWISKTNRQRMAFIRIGEKGEFTETYSNRPFDSIKETVESNYDMRCEGGVSVLT